MTSVFKDTSISFNSSDYSSAGNQIGLTGKVNGAISAINQITDFTDICTKYNINTGSTQCTFTLGTLGSEIKRGYTVIFYNCSQQPLIINDSTTTLITFLDPGGTCLLSAETSSWVVFIREEQLFKRLVVKRSPVATINTTLVQSVSIPANYMGPNDTLVCTATISMSSSSNTAYNVAINGNTVCAMGGSNGNNPAVVYATVSNNNSNTSHTGIIYHSNSGGVGLGSGTLNTQDTSLAFTFELKRSNNIVATVVMFELYIIRDKQNVFSLV